MYIKLTSNIDIFIWSGNSKTDPVLKTNGLSFNSLILSGSYLALVFGQVSFISYVGFTSPQ